MTQHSESGVDASTFRRGFRHVPTVVTVVMFDQQDEAKPVGITIGSFVSLSLEPPLVCFNIMKSARIHPTALRATHFVVHVLRDDQSDLSDRFAMPHFSKDDQLDGVGLADGPFGFPVLDDALVRFDCSMEAIHDAGDHSILIGRIQAILEGRPGRPVVYHQRAYHAIGDHVADTSLEEDD